MKPTTTSKYYEPIWEFILEYKRTHDGAFPTHREICQGANVSTLSIVHRILKVLVRQGKLKRIDRKLCVVGGHWQYKNAT